jgi:hypothetical protein
MIHFFDYHFYHLRRHNLAMRLVLQKLTRPLPSSMCCIPLKKPHLILKLPKTSSNIFEYKRICAHQKMARVRINGTLASAHQFIVTALRGISTLS